jgi:hypothetical protein
MALPASCSLLYPDPQSKHFNGLRLISFRLARVREREMKALAVRVHGLVAASASLTAAVSRS